MTNDGERIARLEATIQYLSQQIEKMQSRVDETYNVVHQLRGVKWSLISIASFCGFVISQVLTYYLGTKHEINTLLSSFFTFR